MFNKRFFIQITLTKLLLQHYNTQTVVKKKLIIFHIYTHIKYAYILKFLKNISTADINSNMVVNTILNITYLYFYSLGTCELKITL